jgi:hypothetical protein
MDGAGTRRENTMVIRTRLAVAAAVVAGIAVLGVAPAAQARTPLSTHVQRIRDHVDRAADRVLVEVDETVEVSVEDVGDTINETGQWLNRTLNPR